MASGKRHKKGTGGPPKSPTPKPVRPSAPSGQQDKLVTTAQQAQTLIPVTASRTGMAPGTPLLDSIRQTGHRETLNTEESHRVPMEYRAQVRGRCQRQYSSTPDDAPIGWRSDLQIWIDQWVERVDGHSPFSPVGLRIVEVQIDWRLISNSGVDEGVIRPVIGAGGWPLIPGSGIKGLFRRACTPERQLRWCGSPCASGDLSPGILRFHGAWPDQQTNSAEPQWTHGLLDVAHPQQNWQVGFRNGREKHNAYGVASLFRPRLKIALSTTLATMDEAEWEEVIDTLKQSLRTGIGGRTCAGYGTTGRLSGDVLFQCGVEGQGPAAKLLDGTPEFRPTMFRAAIRGMALRLFAGLTDAKMAMQVVGRLFGSLSQEEGQNVGILATAYTDPEVYLDYYRQGNWSQPIYATSGLLQWRQMREAARGEDLALLTELLAALHGLTMSLAGFGRSWRRPDHRIFYPSYYKQHRPKPLIGCHWQWSEPKQLPPWLLVQSPRELAQLLQRARKLASRWLQVTQAVTAVPGGWREVIQPQRMMIWTREANSPLDACAIEWFHWKPGSGEQDMDTDPRELKGDDLGGSIKQVSRIWNRMLPIYTPSEVSKSLSAQLGSSAVARPAAAIARPANPMARPDAATARPSAVAGGRSAPNRRPQAPQGDVSITLRSERFLEILVLFPEKQLSPAFIAMMDRGADAGFSRLEW